MKVIKNIIIKPIQIILKIRALFIAIIIEEFKYWFPITKYFFNSFDMIINSLDEYELKEKAVFIKHMPKWYMYYEVNIYIRIIRVLMGLYLIFSYNLIPVLIEYNFDIDLEKTTYFYLIRLFILSILGFFFLLKFILRFIFWKELIKNSPISLKNCIIFWLKQVCNGILIWGVLGIGTTNIDETLKNNGYKPMFLRYSDSMGYYVTGHVTKKVGTENFEDLEYVKGDGQVMEFIRDQQRQTVEKREELRAIYRQQENGREIRRLSEAVRKENKDV